MSQEAYIQKVLRTANAGSGWKDTPLPAAWRESPANASNVLDDDSFDQYQSVVGMLNWLAVKTRPDIRFAVTRLQHRLANPTFEDLTPCNTSSTSQPKEVYGTSPALQSYGLQRSKPSLPIRPVAEWCALDQPTRDAMWLGKIARSFMLPEQRPIEIHTDNIKFAIAAH
ncbi:hypothetical protein PDIDSM_3213 [Penicillium digitatum]|nr:hypothetical protein PDIDSM_3213 [Penicillium digitatum]